MKNQFYLTGLNFVKSKSVNKTKDKSLNRSDSKNTLKSILHKNESFKNYKETMLEFLIKDEIQTVDLFKCEEFYKNLNNKNKKDVNTLISDKSKKKKQIDNLDKQIQKVCLL